ncbi:MAG: ABC transporter substrate-binding protein [Oscillospiraceae bacterium]
MKKLLALMLALVMVFALAACGDSGEATATPTPAATEPAADTTDPSAETPLEPITIKVGYMNNYGSLWSVLTAEQMGYMEEQGITLELSSFADGPTIISAMESGSIDIGYIGDGAHKLCAAGNAEIIALSHISNGDAVIGGPNVTTLEDLAGKTVAYAAGTSSEVILTNALNSVGLTMDDITAMNMDPSAIVTAMLTGDVDACALWSPESLTVLEQVEGATKLADNMTFSDTSISLASWIAMPDRVESERDMFVRFVTALFKGMDYSADEHYDEVAEWVADLLAIDYESAYNQRGDAEWLSGKEVYDGIADGTVAGYYELQQELMISSGNLESEVPVEDYVAFDIMTEVGEALYGEAAAE